jgi:uncharacterized membrane protein (UPF0127 family)
MMKLLNKTTNKVLVPNLEKASSFWQRSRGLLGRDHLPADRALWIVHCNAIHTFFMRFPIDVVFVDRKMVVRKVMPQVNPWRVTLPVLFARDVIEFPAGFLNNNPIRVGEQLHVDHPLS